MKKQRKAVLASLTGLGSVVFAVVLATASIKQIDNVAFAGQQGGRDEIRIELGSNGFTPSEVRHVPGTFAIAVENNTLSGEYTLKLKAEDGTVLNEVRVQKGSSAWTVNLQTGRYTLTEVNHSQWTCSIVVQ
jgi:hypothetical protein